MYISLTCTEDIHIIQPRLYQRKEMYVMAEIIKGVELEKPVREPYVLHDIEELIHMNGLDAISEGPPVDMDSLFFYIYIRQI